MICSRWVILIDTPLRSAPRRSAPRRFAPLRSASRRSFSFVSRVIVSFSIKECVTPLSGLGGFCLRGEVGRKNPLQPTYHTTMENLWRECGENIRSSYEVHMNGRVKTFLNEGFVT